jgi:SAM-dependent MidA family methyltransferase
LPKKYIFFEKSDYLIKKQKSIISEKSISTLVDISWVSDLKNLPSEAFIISNELFDCIPTDIIRHVPGGYQEAYINDNFEIDWKKLNFESDSAFTDLDLPKNLPHNYIFEYSHAQRDIINEISAVLDKAYFLIFDYGLHIIRTVFKR